MDSQDPEKRKRGRPPGPSDPEKSRAWQPKKWTPDYETVCTEYYVLGFKQSLIAERLNFSEVHVNNIINSDAGKAFGRLLVEKIRAQTTGTIVDRLARLEDQALSNIEAVLSDVKVRAENPLGVVDRSFRLLEGKGALKPISRSLEGVGNTTINNNTQTNNILITDAAGAKELTVGLQRALEAMKSYDCSKQGEVIQLPAGSVTDE